MPDKSMKTPKRAKDGNKWIRTGFGTMLDSAAISDLKPQEIKKLTVAAIREHRRRLDRAQKLHERIEASDPGDLDRLKCDYDEAMRIHESHHMVVHMLVDILGYVPKLEKKLPECR